MNFVRADIMARLESRPWFKASRPSIRQMLHSLGDDCNGYLHDLANRPDVIGGVRQISIDQIEVGDTSPTFGIWTIILVQNVKDPSLCYRYQYFSWRHGPASGSKGVLLVRAGGKISHLVVLKAESFALGKPFYDCPGGFMEVGDQKTVDLASGLVNRMKMEVVEEVGIQLTSEQMKIHNLGRIQTDPGMTNNHPALFAIEIDASVAGGIKEGERVNPDVYELNSGPVLVPIGRLWGPNGLIETNDCSYFHILITRLLSRGFITGPG